MVFMADGVRLDSYQAQQTADLIDGADAAKEAHGHGEGRPRR